MKQDVGCNRCEDCPVNFYINRSCPGGNILSSDTHQCSPCKKQCSPGFFPLGSCSGSGITDTVECKECLNYCPEGMYMHAPCNGSASSMGMPDCRPCDSCSPGMYISGGGCRNGTAKQATDRICTACKTCRKDMQRLLNPCSSGMDFEDVVKCETCDPCPAGHYISKPCDGVTDSVRVCSPCKPCSPGFFRHGP